MSTVQVYEKELAGILKDLPDDKAGELLDFARFLVYKYTSKSQIDKGALLLQQKALNKIWDNPDEDIYEL